jgi:hypothetical protein
MSTVRTNNILDASGGNTATINSMTPTADSLQGFRNRIINGDMGIDQRNAGASFALPNSTTSYTLDRWFAFENGSMAFSFQRSSTAPTGFTNSMLVTTTTGAVAGSSERSQLGQRIEGFNIADLGWGTASAKTVTLSFWIRSSLTGQFGGSLQNVNADRSYPFSFTISAANTFEYKTITIAGDTTGTWATDNSTGIQLNFDLGMGSSLLGTAGAWAAADYRGATGDTKLSGTTGATMYITGVQLEVGSVATPFERRDYGRELMLCYRYYYLHASFAETNYGVIGIGYNYSSSQMNSIVYFPVTMRIAPALISTSGTDYYMFERNSGDDYLNSLTLSGSSTPKVGSLVNNTNISGTAGQAGRLLVFTSGASVAFNAEL